jgi:PAS fold.
MKKNILLIEEDAYIAWEKKSLLENDSYKVVHERSWALAAERLLAKPDAFDLLVLNRDEISARKSGVGLQSFEKQIRLLLDKFPELVAIRDAGGKIIAANRSYRGLHRAELEALAARSVFGSIRAELRRKMRDRDREASERGSTTELEEYLSPADNRWRTYITRRVSICDDCLNPLGVIAISQSFEAERDSPQPREAQASAAETLSIA